jgi:hypothetical protein
VYDYRGG